MFKRPDRSLPSDSSLHSFHTKGVRVLPKPQNVQIGLPPGFNGCRLNVIHYDGITKGLRISKRVAEVLLALGFSAEG